MKNRKGFTIVELVIVIAVIAILAAVLIPTFSGVIQKANDSAALQEATSTMKSALAMSKSGTLADDTLFLVGDTTGIAHSYIYSGNSIGEDTTHIVEKDNTYGNAFTTATVIAKGDKYNTIIINDKLAVDLTSADSQKIAAIIKGALRIDTVPGLTKVTSENANKAATGASYLLTIGEGADAVNWSVFVNSDFAKDVVVFTYAN